VTRAGALLRGAFAGATTMYFFDPDVGSRRRGLVRDQLVHWSNVLRDELEIEVRDARHRVQDAVAATRRLADGSREPTSDSTIAQRLRERFASLEQPGGITVEVENGCVHLRGPALARDAERARRAVRRMSGARELIDELEVHERADVPALRMSAPGRMRGMEPAARLAVGAVGTIALLPVLRRVSVLAAMRLLGVAGVGAAIASVEASRRRAGAGSPGDRSLPVVD
jgi:hypothetical protein